jgi:hypothetical protein
LSNSGLFRKESDMFFLPLIFSPKLSICKTGSHLNQTVLSATPKASK